MWRDRTQLFISYRSSYSHKPAKRTRFTSTFAANDNEDRRGLLAAGDDASENGDSVIEMDLLPPRWADLSDEVNEILGVIARKSATLERLHSKHVLPGFDDNRSAEEGEIERLTTDITSAFHKCQEKIRKIQQMASHSQSKAEEQMAKNIQVALATKVQEASTSFRKKQSAYLKKLRGISGMTTPLDFRTGSPAPYSYNSDADPQSDVSFSKVALQQSTTLTSNDAAIMQREREITDIAKGIIELAEIFNELQTMVIDQGTMLDRIDYNVEQLNVHVRAADKEMNIAQGYQKKTTKRKIIFLLLLCIIGMIILVSIKPRHSGSEVVVKPPEEEPDLDGTPMGPANRVRIRGREVVW